MKKTVFKRVDRRDNRDSACPASGVDTLDVGKSAERQIAAGQSHVFRVQLTAGDYARVDIDHRFLPLRVRFISPGRASELVIDDAQYGETPSPLSLPPVAALRAAQRSIQSDPQWAEPYYWAGFVFHGEWR